MSHNVRFAKSLAGVICALALTSSARAADDHPITKGLRDFEVADETYNQQTFCDGIHVLVSTDHPRSDKTIAWVHQYGKARVFGFQSGHDAKVWTDDSFRRLMGQGIRWAGGRLPGAEKK